MTRARIALTANLFVVSSKPLSTSLQMPREDWGNICAPLSARQIVAELLPSKRRGDGSSRVQKANRVHERLERSSLGIGLCRWAGKENAN